MYRGLVTCIHNLPKHNVPGIQSSTSTAAHVQALVLLCHLRLTEGSAVRAAATLTVWCPNASQDPIQLRVPPCGSPSWCRVSLSGSVVVLGYIESSSMSVYCLPTQGDSYARESLGEGNQLPRTLQPTASTRNSGAFKGVAAQSAQTCVLAGNLFVPGDNANCLGADLIGETLVVLTADGSCVVYDLAQPMLQHLIKGERLPAMVRLSHAICVLLQGTALSGRCDT